MLGMTNDVTPMTQDYSELLDYMDTPPAKRIPALLNAELEERKAELRKRHHGQDCIICFERKCVCKARV
jgi:hypothetical protein